MSEDSQPNFNQMVNEIDSPEMMQIVVDSCLADIERIQNEPETGLYLRMKAKQGITKDDLLNGLHNRLKDLNAKLEYLKSTT